VFVTVRHTCRAGGADHKAARNTSIGFMARVGYCRRRAAARMRNVFKVQASAPGVSVPVWIRTAGGHDVEMLSDHFRKLSCEARHNRFMGVTGDLARIARACLTPARRAECFAFVAECRRDRCDIIVGEASYAFDRMNGCGEFALSVADEFQRHGLGTTLLTALQFRAISLGYRELCGESLKSNDAMKNFARKAGFEFTHALDWRAVRFEKRL
jgi:RimJ/RimL family protein N-acetyltransferase